MRLRFRILGLRRDNDVGSIGGYLGDFSLSMTLSWCVAAASQCIRFIWNQQIQI